MKRNKIVTKTRRANGEGSIYQRNDGRWAGYITLGFDENGKQKKKLIYGHTQTEVAKKLSDLSGRITSNNYETIERKTFGELMFEWLMVFKKSSVTPRTFESNIRNFKLHIEPVIGNLKLYEVDTFVIQKVINIMIEKDYSNGTLKRIKHMIGQFFEYAIDNKWVQVNPTHKIKVKIHDRKIYDDEEKYKALPPDVRLKFLEALASDQLCGFIKPMTILMLFAGLRSGEAIAVKWRNVDFENKTLKVERAITQVPKFNENGDIIERITVVGDTKTACSVREIPIADIVVETLKDWREKQVLRQQTDKYVTGDITSQNAYIFANDDGSVRTYSGSRKIFNRFLRRNKLNKFHIHFHGLRHTFSNMLFEMNENPKVIQQLLGHRDVKTTITVYNSVDNEYIRQTTDKFNEKIKEEQMVLEHKQREDILEARKDKLISDMSDDEFDDVLQQLLEERKERKRKRESDMEM